MIYRISYVREYVRGIETETIHPAMDDRADAFLLAEAAAGRGAEFATRGENEWSYHGAKGLVVITACSRGGDLDQYEVAS